MQAEQVDLNRQFLNGLYRLAMLPLIAILCGVAIIFLGNFAPIYFLLVAFICLPTFILFAIYAISSPSLTIHEDHLVVRQSRQSSSVVYYSEVREVIVPSFGSGFIRLSTTEKIFYLPRVLFKNERSFIKFVSDKISQTDSTNDDSEDSDGVYEPIPRFRRLLYGAIPGVVGVGIYLFCYFAYPEFDLTNVMLGSLIALFFGLYIAWAVRPP